MTDEQDMRLREFFDGEFRQAYAVLSNSDDPKEIQKAQVKQAFIQECRQSVYEILCGEKPPTVAPRTNPYDTSVISWE